MIQNTAFTHDFYSTTEPLLKLHSHRAFPSCMQPAIWAMHVVMKLWCQRCRDAKWTDHSPAIRYILMESISAAVPWGRPLNNACESSGSQWPEAYPPLLLPLMAYPVRVTGQHVACWTVLHTAQTTTDRFWFQKQSRATKVITGFYKERNRWTMAVLFFFTDSVHFFPPFQT